MKRLNVGSGTRPTLGDGWMNCDINPDLPSLDFVCDMHEIPLEDNTLDEIHSIHSIEHIPISKARITLKEWLRVLKPGGALVCDTPNIHRNISLYLNGGWEQDFATLTPDEQAYCSLNGVPNKTLWINFKCFSSSAQWDVHFANYDSELLTALCLDAGFSKVDVIQYSPSLCVRAYK